MDFIAEAVMSSDPDRTWAGITETAMVIFDESRHPQNALLADSYNTVYFLLVYFTGEGLAMLLLVPRALRHLRSRVAQEARPRAMAPRLQHHLLRVW